MVLFFVRFIELDELLEDSGCNIYLGNIECVCCRFYFSNYDIDEFCSSIDSEKKAKLH